MNGVRGRCLKLASISVNECVVGCCERYMEHRFGGWWMRAPCEERRREERSLVGKPRRAAKFVLIVERNSRRF